MNHDVSHCSAYNKLICPKECPYAMLEEDLSRNAKYFGGVPITYEDASITPKCAIMQRKIKKMKAVELYTLLDDITSDYAASQQWADIVQWLETMCGDHPRYEIVICATILWRSKYGTQGKQTENHFRDVTKMIDKEAKDES